MDHDPCRLDAKINVNIIGTNRVSIRVVSYEEFVMKESFS